MANTSTGLFSQLRDFGTGGLSLSYRERPAINYGRIGAITKPTNIVRGAYSLLSLPIYNSDDEEIYFNHSVVRRWDGISDITFGCMAVYDTAQATPTEFKIVLEWNHYDYTKNVVPSAVKTVSVLNRTASSQYTASPLTFTIDYDADGAGNEIKANEVIGGRIYRAAKTTAAAAECSGEIMLHGFYIQYNRDKIGVSR